MTRAVVAVLTYRRTAELAALLPVLREQAVETGLRVLVVDNDPAGSGAAVCAAAGVAHVAEPRPGIAAARNRALDEAGGDDLLVFLDDDELPEPGWLRALLDTHARERGAGVVGPVVSRYAAPLSPWVAAGGFFVRRRLPTGTPVDVAATNNLLLDLAAVRRLGLRFDERLGLTGGSDTLFTRTLTGRGGRLVWCDEAVVTDVVPADRVTRRWVLARALRSGNSWSITSLLLADDARARARVRAALTARGALRVGAGASRWLFGVLTGALTHQARGARTCARGLGMVGGCWGHVHTEYARA